MSLDNTMNTEASQQEVESAMYQVKPVARRSGTINRSAKARRMRRSGGQALVMFAIALPALCGVMALGADVGMQYFQYEQIQVAADAAALAGTYYLPNQPSKATTQARTYAQTNGAASSEITSVTTNTGA